MRVLTVTIGTGLTQIPDSVFKNCLAIEKAEISASVTAVKPYAFYGCAAVKTLTLNEGLRIIGYNAFDGCAAIREIVIPNTVTEIGDYAFNGASAAKKLTLGNSLTTIGQGAFLSCEGLTQVEIPETVTKIESSAFGRTGITTVKIHGNIYDFDEYSFDRSPVSRVSIAEGVDRVTRDMVIEKSTLKSMYIPESVNFIDDDAFVGTTDKFFIAGKKGSYAENFAKEHGIRFVDGEQLSGDVDASGDVTATDALWALQAYVGSRQLDDAAFTAADVNLDGQVNTSDALAILQYAVKLRDTLPIA